MLEKILLYNVKKDVYKRQGFTYKEDIITGAAAAAKGGFTSVVCMANTKPAVDNIETLEYIQKKGETRCV